MPKSNSPSELLDQRKYWVHRLANLLLLTRKKNAEASNFEFEEKNKEVLRYQE